MAVSFHSLSGEPRCVMNFRHAVGVAIMSRLPQKTTKFGAGDELYADEAIHVWPCQVPTEVEQASTQKKTRLS